MTLKDLLGDAYKVSMTAEEIETALAERDLIDRSEAETLATNRAAATKRLLDAANKKLAEANKKNTETGVENANLLERVAALEEDKKNSDRLSNIATHKASLLGQGYADDLATTAATALVDGDIAAFMVAQGKFNEAQKQAWKDEILKGTGDPAGGGSGAGTDYTTLKAKALADGNDLEYMRLSRMESEQNTSEK